MRQIPKTEKDAERFKKLAAQSALGEDHLHWKDGALWIKSAAVIDPSKIFDTFEIRNETYRAAQDRSKYSHVFLAVGYGIKTLTPKLAPEEMAPELNMRFSRGQLSWAKPIWDHPTAYGGYAINMGEAALVGATHDRVGTGDPFEIRSEDDAKNLAALSAISGKNAEPLPRKSRASVRVTTADTLPLLAELGESVWALTGLGSRGFTFAPLLAEALIANICGEVGPLDRNLRTKFSTLR